MPLLGNYSIDKVYTMKIKLSRKKGTSIASAGSFFLVTFNYNTRSDAYIGVTVDRLLRASAISGSIAISSNASSASYLYKFLPERDGSNTVTLEVKYVAKTFPSSESVYKLALWRSLHQRVKLIRSTIRDYRSSNAVVIPFS